MNHSPSNKSGHIHVNGPRGLSPIALLLLTSIYVLAFVDRQIVNILAEQIKEDLSLSDWQVGILAGPAFAIPYMLATLPMARLSDRVNRVRILSAVIAVWSCCTALSGFAGSYLVIVFGRVGVGASEAGCVPAAHSLISDLTPREQRARALAIFSTGLPLGSLIGLAAGGVMAHHFGWRSAFLLVALPGIALAALLLVTLRDPRPAFRSISAANGAGAEAELPSLAGTLRNLWATPSFAWMTCGASLLALAGYSHAAFFASFFMRNHSAELDALSRSTYMGGALAFLGLALGLAIGISGAAGTTLGGFLGDRFAARNFKGYMKVPTFATLLGTPLTLAALIVPNAALAIGLLAGASLLKSMWYGPVFATIQGLVPPRSRATSVSVFLLVMNGVGLGLGPPLLGFLSDWLGTMFPAPEALRIAMIALTSLVFLAAGCFALAGRALPVKAVS